jgi:hypothetical protein
MTGRVSPRHAARTAQSEVGYLCGLVLVEVPHHPLRTEFDTCCAGLDLERLLDAVVEEVATSGRFSLGRPP